MATEEQTTYTEGNRIYSSISQGERLFILNRKVTKLAFYLAKTGAPPGNLTFLIRRVSDDSIIVSKLWGLAAGIAAAPVLLYEVTFNTPALINEEAYILAQVDGGNLGNSINIWRAGWDIKAGEVFTYRNAGGVYTDSPLRDCAYIYTYNLAPTVTTDPATAISAILATPNGTLDNDGGEACDCGFEWGDTPAYGNTTPTQSKITGQTFAQTVGPLNPTTTYYFRAFATNSIGTSYGAQRSFTTLVALPTVTSDPATMVSLLAATPNGTLTDDGGEVCACGFEWGTTIAYGNTTPTQDRVTGQAFSQYIFALLGNTTYHFRAFATNSAGTGYGADRTLTTLMPAAGRAYALSRSEL